MEEISKYGDSNSHYRSPALASRTSEKPEKSSKKEKKWSLGGFFRRRKKEVETDSSSEEEPKKGFLQRRRMRKEDKRKKRPSKTVGTFDHVLVAPVLYAANGNRVKEDENGIFSEPTTKSAVRSNLMGGSHEILIRSSRESLNRARAERSQSRGSIPETGSLDGGAKGKRTRSKTRADVSKERTKNDSSSDDCSQRSTASSITKFKSDDSLNKKDNNSKKTRSARTERYMKRLTKEDEHVLNNEADHDQKADVVLENGVHVHKVLIEDGVRSSRRLGRPLAHSSSNPLPQKPIAVSTVPPSHSVHRTTSNPSDNQRNPFYSSHKPLRRYEQPRPNAAVDVQPERSISYDCNINRATPVSEGEVLHVQFPIGKPVPKQRNPNLINSYHSSSQSLQRATPPPPPPRDPQRRYLTNYQYEPARPMSYAFETGGQQHRPPGRSYPPPANLNRTSHGWGANQRSNSEDHINQGFISMPVRPASATPETPQQRYIRRHPNSDHYQYFAQNTPRSRKPIHIAAQPEQTYMSDSQMVHNASEFWRRKDLEEVRRKSQEFFAKTKPEAKKNYSVINAPVKNESLSSESSPKMHRESSPLIKIPPAPPVRRSSRQSSGSSIDCGWVHDSEDGEKPKRRSKNLEEALNELESIYKSLGLGDEDLLDRAERRDVPSIVTQKLLSRTPDDIGSGTRSIHSDSGFNYEPTFVESLRRKREARKVPDKLNDDMAFRRLNRDKPPTLDVNSAVSQVSYLLASPILGNTSADENDNEYSNGNEPDVTLDDVVYRNYKQKNNMLKIQDPQPLFGIPLGPISTASNSDYLHAVPENRSRPRFIPQRSPDIVKDDLAYRSLRKDTSSSLNQEDCLNNNDVPTNSERFKKKRAVRSMSANIFNLMQRDEMDKTQSLMDVADTMDMAHRIVKDRQHKINSKIAVSDTETQYLRPVERSMSPTSTETLTGSRPMLNEPRERIFKQKLQVYIPLMDTGLDQKPPKCPTPDRKTKFVEEAPDKSNLEDLLAALAMEARETSEKLGEDLKLLDERSPKKSSSPAEELVNKSTMEKLSDIEAVSERAKLCGERLERADILRPAVSSVEDRCVLDEQVNELPHEPSVFRSFANVIVTRSPDVVSAPAIESDRDLRSSRELSGDESTDFANAVDSGEPGPEHAFTRLQTLCGAGEQPGRVPCAVSDLLTPPGEFCSTDDFDVLRDQNYLQVTRTESEHSSGFHTESQCSSGPDSLVENADNSLTSEDEHVRCLDELVSHSFSAPAQFAFVHPGALNVILECLEPRDDPAATRDTSNISDTLPGDPALRSTRDTTRNLSSSNLLEHTNGERIISPDYVTSEHSDVLRENQSYVNSSCNNIIVSMNVENAEFSKLSLINDSKSFMNLSHDLYEEIKNINEDFKSNSIEIAKVVAELNALAKDTVDKEIVELQGSIPDLIEITQNSGRHHSSENNCSVFNSTKILSVPQSAGDMKFNEIEIVNSDSNLNVPRRSIDCFVQIQLENNPIIDLNCTETQVKIDVIKDEIQYPVYTNICELSDESHTCDSDSNLLNAMTENLCTDAHISDTYPESNSLKDSGNPPCESDTPDSVEVGLDTNIVKTVVDCDTNQTTDMPTPSSSNDDETALVSRSQSVRLPVQFEGYEDIIDADVFWRAFNTPESSEGPSSSRRPRDLRDDDDRRSDKCVEWYNNPTTVALACSYALACIHQFALIDIVTFLGLLLAILSVIAAMIL